MSIASITYLNHQIKAIMVRVNHQLEEAQNWTISLHKLLRTLLLDTTKSQVFSVEDKTNHTETLLLFNSTSIATKRKHSYPLWTKRTWTKRATTRCTATRWISRKSARTSPAPGATTTPPSRTGHPEEEASQLATKWAVLATRKTSPWPLPWKTSPPRKVTKIEFYYLFVC